MTELLVCPNCHVYNYSCHRTRVFGENGVKENDRNIKIKAALGAFTSMSNVRVITGLFL